MVSKSPPEDGTPPDPQNSETSSQRVRWIGALGILISVVLLWWTLRDIHPADLIAHLRRVSVLPLVVCIATATLAFPIRTIRWRYLLGHESSGGVRAPFVPLWHATAIGFMANNVLPTGRVGEVARAYAAYRLTAIPFVTAMTTLVVERVTDGIALVVLLAVASAFGGFTSETRIGEVAVGDIITTAAGIFALLLLVATAAVFNPRLAIRVVSKICSVVLPASWAARVVGVCSNVLNGLEVLRQPGRFLVVIAWSFVVWGVNGISFWLGMVAFDFQTPWSAAYVLQTIIAFGVAVPSSPGYFGPFEIATRATLTAYGVSTAAAVSYAVTYHLTTFIPITLLGLYSLSRAHLHLADLRRSNLPQFSPSAEQPAETVTE